jgi:hypothetical protein
VFGDSGENGEFGNEVFTDVHDGGDVSTAVTVVGCRPDGNDRFILEVELQNVSKLTVTDRDL